MRRTELTIKEILSWADSYYARKGRWPNQYSGRVWEPADEKWPNIDQSLRLGHRGLQRGQTLARLLAKHRGKRNSKQLPKYTLQQILAWADAHHARTGRWSQRTDGRIPNSHGETWNAVEMALNHGQRGLRGGTTLAQLLATKRRVRNRVARPRLTVRQILRWADEFNRKTGNWPTDRSGSITQSDGDTWKAVDRALRKGRRGLRRSSLAKLLARHRGVPFKHRRRPPLTIEQVLQWADEYHARTGRWPKLNSGRIANAAAGETWKRVNEALVRGERGMTGGKSLAVLLAERRSVRSRVALAPLSEEQILKWVRAYKRRNGCWPNRSSGPIPTTDGETWSGIDSALKTQRRGLNRRSSLTQLIESHL